MSQSKQDKSKWVGQTATCTKCGHTWTISESDDLDFVAADGIPDYTAVATCPKDGSPATIRKSDQA